MSWYIQAKKNLRSETKDAPIYNDKWMPVVSSFITHIAYYEPLKMFEIKLRDGHEYSFTGVPKQIFNRLMKSKSKGEFFNRVIKPNYSKSKNN